MLELMEVCQRVASSKATVLIQGESGTGKELYAKYIHAGALNARAFVAVNCASLPRRCLRASCLVTRRAPLPEPWAER